MSYPSVRAASCSATPDMRGYFLDLVVDGRCGGTDHIVSAS
jgi:hypothetical protein